MYRLLYESKEVNISNRELIAFIQHFEILNKNITNLGDEIQNLEENITIFSFKVGISILSLSAMGVLAIDFYMRKKKDWKKLIIR